MTVNHDLSSAHRQHDRSGQAVVVIAVGFMALALAYSVRAALGLAMPVWERELGWSRGHVSSIAATALVLMAVVAPLAGILLDRRGLRLTLLSGLIAVLAASVLVSVSGNTITLLVGFGVVGGVGFGIVSTHVIAAAVARLYPDQVGFASGIASSGSTAGQFVIVPLIAFFLSSFGWEWGFAALGVGTAVLIPLIWLIPVEQPVEAGNRGVGSSSEPGLWLAEVRILLLSPVFHLLFWSFLICGYTTTGVIETHLIPYAQLCGFAPVPSAAAYGLLSAVNMIGMISIGWLTDRVNRPLLLGTIYLIRGLTFWFLLNVGSSYENLILFAVIFGMVDYSTVPVTTSLVASHLGLRSMGFVMGLLTTGHQLGAAAGAGIGGYVFDRSEAYDLVWSSSIALAIVAALLVLLVRDEPTDSGPNGSRSPRFRRARN